MNAAEGSIARFDRDRSHGDPEMQRHGGVRRLVKGRRFKLPPRAGRSHERPYYDERAVVTDEFEFWTIKADPTG